ncbi:hypothetical protein ACI2OX_04120 [Bacillus sp. N9]
MIAPHTKWSIPLFPARVIDPEKVENVPDQAEIIQYLEEVTSALPKWDVIEQTQDNKQMSMYVFA